MILDRKEKQPSEIKDYVVDYSAWLSEVSGGDTILSATVAVVCLDVPANTTLLVPNIVVSNVAVAVWLSAGTPDLKYKVTVKATTSGGRLDESEFIMKIKEY